MRACNTRPGNADSSSSVPVSVHRSSTRRKPSNTAAPATLKRKRSMIDDAELSIPSAVAGPQRVMSRRASKGKGKSVPSLSPVAGTFGRSPPGGSTTPAKKKLRTSSGLAGVSAAPTVRRLTRAAATVASSSKAPVDDRECEPEST